MASGSPGCERTDPDVDQPGGLAVDRLHHTVALARERVGGVRAPRRRGAGPSVHDPAGGELEHERLDQEPTPAFTVHVAASVLQGEILERGNRSSAARPPPRWPPR